MDGQVKKRSKYKYTYVVCCVGTDLEKSGINNNENFYSIQSVKLLYK